MIEPQEDFDAQTEAIRMELMAVAAQRRQLEQERNEQAAQIAILESALACAQQYAIYAVSIHDERQAGKSIAAIQRALAGAHQERQSADQGITDARAREAELREQLLQRWKESGYVQKDSSGSGANRNGERDNDEHAGSTAEDRAS